MEKSKKQKIEREIRQSLKTIFELSPNLASSNSTQNKQALLAKVYPQLPELNSLRIVTVLEIIYILEVYIELLQKSDPVYVENMRIGIIGGGITGRLILNSLLPFSKDGLNLKNITISTRQTQNFKIYSQNFGIKCHFDNELTAKQSDFLIVATPATLDNWIIADLRQPLASRIQTSLKIYPSLPTTNLQRQISQKLKTVVGKIDDKSKKGLDKSIIKQKEQVRKFPFKPLVMILTSDFHEQKCKKLFKFPVLNPSIRSTDIPILKQTLQMFTVQSAEFIDVHQKLLAWWLNKEKQTTKEKQHKDNIQGSNQNQKETFYPSGSKFLNTNFGRILEVLSFVIDAPLNSTSVSSSISNTISVAESAKENKKKDETQTQVLDIVAVQGSLDDTLFKKIRKWTMAYNNYVS